jgi:hypothetical protein
MWIFSKAGFVSIVRHKSQPGKLIVRARVREDLERFAKLLDEITGEPHAIRETPSRDYRFRTVATKQAVAQVLARQVTEIDYTNFKDAVHGDPQRDDAYMDVWSAMHRLQRDKLRHP